MSKVAVFAFAGLASAVSWVDEFTIFSEYQYFETGLDDVCNDCNVTVASSERYIWGRQVAGCGSNPGRVEVNTGNGELDWVPASNCLDKFETMWDFSSSFDFTNEGNDDAVVTEFGSAGFNFRNAFYTLIACDTPCDTLGGISSLSVSGEDGFSVGAIPPTCARYTKNMGSDFDSFNTALFSEFSNFENIDWTQIRCFALGTETKIPGNTMSLRLIGTQDTFTTTTTVTASLIGDPHLSGFHGERVELKDLNTVYYSIYCDATTMVNIRTEPSPTGASYISEILFNVAGDVSEHSVNSMGSEKVVVDAGNLSFDIRRSVDGVAFLDIAITASEVLPAGGILGRTLSAALSPAEMDVVAPFVVSAEQHVASHTCQQ